MPISPSVAWRASGSTARCMIWPEKRSSMFIPCGQRSAERRREQEAGNPAQAGARMGRRADVVDVRNVGAMIDARLERAPEEELVERASPAIRVAADKVNVHRLEDFRRVSAPGDLDRAAVLAM